MDDMRVKSNNIHQDIYKLKDECLGNGIEPKFLIMDRDNYVLLLKSSQVLSGYTIDDLTEYLGLKICVFIGSEKRLYVK
jgi:hypothetical protein